ncbi:MarR family transcriptional regulator [Nocardioides sp. TF02-7]|nr:MarR family transcriptional regulator [Nocardioides sp. TF02-7]
MVRDRQPSQLALANRLGIDRTVMTYLVDDLVDAGLVERRPNPRDRRQRRVVATDRGRALVAAACEQVYQAECDLLGGLDQRERDHLRALLSKAACAHADDGHDACEVVGEDLDD